MLDNAFFGFKVVAAEVAWRISQSIHAYEIRQLKKRLRLEYQALGEHSFSNTLDRDLEHAEDNPERSVAAAFETVSFLKEEIARLELLWESKRRDMLAARARQWNLRQNDAN